MTLACLRSIQEQTDPSLYEVVLVDNASADGSADAVEEAFPEVTLIRSSENLGFAGANNIAAEHAVGEYLFLLNSDTVVLDRAIERLLVFAEAEPQARIWGLRTLFGDGSINYTNCHGQMTLWSLFCRATGLSVVLKSSTIFNPEGYGGWERDSIRQVDIVSGCAFLIESKFWHQLSGLDTLFFMYGEETDLCLRAKAQGAHPMVTHEAEIIHYGGASDVVRTDMLVKLLCGKMTLILRHFSGMSRWLARWLHMGFPLSRSMVHRFLNMLGFGGTSGAVWVEVWARRSEWQGGFIAHPVPVDSKPVNPSEELTQTSVQ